MAYLRSILVGREETCDIKLSDRSVSRVHAELQLLDNGDFYVTDCNSSQGTFVEQDGGRTPVKQMQVRRRAVLVLGKARLPLGDVVAYIERTSARPPVVLPVDPGGETTGELVLCDSCSKQKIQGRPCPNCKRRTEFAP